jgi:hypothetical protein
MRFTEMKAQSALSVVKLLHVSPGESVASLLPGKFRAPGAERDSSARASRALHAWYRPVACA